MANYRETVTPYEFLERFDDEGKYQGSHIKFLTITYKDDVVIAKEVGPALDVAAYGKEGFPLNDILALAHAQLIIAADEAIAENKSKDAAIAELQSQAEASKDVEIAELKAQLEATKITGDIPGSGDAV